MGIFKISGEGLSKIAPLIEEWNETLIFSCLQGHMGMAWADDENKPKSAQIITADFCFFAGKISSELVKNRPVEYKSNFIIMVPQNENWSKLIEQIYGEKAVKKTRFAIKKESDIFDRAKLDAMVDCVAGEYEIKLFDEEIYKLAMANEWSEDFCSQFGSFEEFHKNGIGVAAILKGELVAGASSYTFYSGGIEIEIDTRKDYRRRGLALACGAKLILECLDRNIYPSWDAQNKASVALSEKLGYHFDEEYSVFEINNF